MQRSPLLEKIAHYKTLTHLKPIDLEIASKFESFINNNEDCFHRTLETGHLTASCWLWNEDYTACLFTLHKKLHQWLQLGGHADGDPDLINVCLKEAYEESGLKDIELISDEILDLSIHEIPPYKNVSAHLHYDVRFQLRAKKNDPLIISDESHDLKWIYLNEFNRFNWDLSILRMHSKALYMLSKAESNSL
ncbi:MAG: hypothetical protein S4CHLAM7_13030 [Chlamydiae bacterium]|nr:hypothetical protein [Chlamydiota bacterium]